MYCTVHTAGIHTLRKDELAVAMFQEISTAVLI